MNRQDPTFRPLYTYGFILDDIPADILEDISKEVDYIQNDFTRHMRFNSYLAGKIENEFVFNKKDTLLPYVSYLCEKLHRNIFPLFDGNIKFNFCERTPGVPDLWVNFQKKHEYNPSHTHTGFYSFVIWLRVPFHLEDERKQAHVKNANNVTNGFIFSFPDSLKPGGIFSIGLPVDKAYEGKICVFPSWLNHAVEPFYTSDEYRVSISGNLDAVS